MRGKIIKAFLGVYLALSMAYGGVRAAYLTAVAAMTPPEEPTTLAVAPSFGQTVLTAPPSLAPTVTPDAGPSPSPSPETLEAPSETPSLTEAPPEMPSPSQAPAPEPTPEPSEALAEPPAEEDQETSLDAAPAPEVPSLEDYLSQLHCGGCGRNCLLSSPRCRTGKRKAETYTTEYYTEYGTTDEI